MKPSTKAPAAAAKKPAAKAPAAKAGSKASASKTGASKSAPGVAAKFNAPKSKKNAVAKTAAKTRVKRDPRILSMPRTYGIGGALPPKRDLTRYVKWPKYIRLQRQRAILRRRLKVPPAINQFRRTVDKNGAVQVLRLLTKIRPETKVEKRNRLRAEAEKLAASIAAGGETDIKKLSAKPIVVKYGINHVTALIEARKARLVVIAHDVDPIELVVFLPALCRKMNVPYLIIKGKSRLGAIVHKRTATALAVTDVHASQEQDLLALTKLSAALYGEKVDEIRRTWGGGIMGRKSLDRQRKLEELKAKQSAK